MLFVYLPENNIAKCVEVLTLLIPRYSVQVTVQLIVECFAA